MVADVRRPCGSRGVVFLIERATAAIPALVVLGALAAALAAVLAGMGLGLLGRLLR